MAVFRPPFAYNTGGPISGTTQYDDLVVGNIEVDYSSDYGGIKWWGSPEELTGYIIGNVRPGGQPVPSGVSGVGTGTGVQNGTTTPGDGSILLKR